jgi:uncharacterized protein (TIGR03067 family)
MRRFHLVTAAVLLAGLFGSAAGQDGKEKSDRDRIQGTWVAVSLKLDGDQAPAELLKDFRITFAGGEATIKFMDKVQDGGTYSLNLSTNPKSIIINPPKEKANEMPVRGIYAFESDDLLKICTSEQGEAPKDFSSKPGSKTMLLILKREKK